MTQETTRLYMVNPGELAVVHRTTCANVMTTAKGPYATRGAAIDAAFALSGRVWEAGCCIRGASRVSYNPDA